MGIPRFGRKNLTNLMKIMGSNSTINKNVVLNIISFYRSYGGGEKRKHSLIEGSYTITIISKFFPFPSFFQISIIIRFIYIQIKRFM